MLKIRDAASLHISQTLTYVGSESGKLLTLRQLLANAPPLPLLIFVQEKERATELHQELIYDNLTVDMLHSGMTAKQREDSVSRFRMGETWVLVCTEVMARGMDFGGVKGVLNYDFPASVQSYIHRIGTNLKEKRSSLSYLTFTFMFHRSDRTSWSLRNSNNLFHRRRCTLCQIYRQYCKSIKCTTGGICKCSRHKSTTGWVHGRDCSTKIKYSRVDAQTS